MQFLLDTNILCRIVRPDDPQHAPARKAVEALLQRRIELYVTPQIEREFWSVATRPREANGLGMTAAEAREQLAAVERVAGLKPDTAEVHRHWKRLVADFEILGKRCHDAAIVAAMLAHGVENLLTFDADDFERYQRLQLVRTWPPERVPMDL